MLPADLPPQRHELFRTINLCALLEERKLEKKIFHCDKFYQPCNCLRQLAHQFQFSFIRFRTRFQCIYQINLNAPDQIAHSNISICFELGGERPIWCERFKEIICESTKSEPTPRLQ